MPKPTSPFVPEAAKIAGSDSQAPSIGDILRIFLHRFPIVLILSAGCLLLATAFFSIAVNEYTATATMEIDKVSSMSLGLDDLLGIEWQQHTGAGKLAVMMNREQSLENEFTALNAIERMNLLWARPVYEQERFVGKLARNVAVLPVLGEESASSRLLCRNMDTRLEGVNVTAEIGDSPDSTRKVIVDPGVKRGDAVFVRRAETVYILGATRPGGYLKVDRGLLNLTRAFAFVQETRIVASRKLPLIPHTQAGKMSEIPVEHAKVVQGKTIAPMLRSENVCYVGMIKLKASLVRGAGGLSSAASAVI